MTNLALLTAMFMVCVMFFSSALRFPMAIQTVSSLTHFSKLVLVEIFSRYLYVLFQDLWIFPMLTSKPIATTYGCFILEAISFGESP